MLSTANAEVPLGYQISTFHTTRCILEVLEKEEFLKDMVGWSTGMLLVIGKLWSLE